MGERLPASMTGYMTWELAQLLMRCTPQQVAVIDATVRSGHLVEQPMVPWRLVSGDDAMVNPATIYKTEAIDPETGKRKRRDGWAHQPHFVQAITMAKRLALEAQIADDATAVAKARQKAKSLAEKAVSTWDEIMADPQQPAKDRNDAAGRVVQLATVGEERKAEEREVESAFVAVLRRLDG